MIIWGWRGGGGRAWVPRWAMNWQLDSRGWDSSTSIIVEVTGQQTWTWISTKSLLVVSRGLASSWTTLGIYRTDTTSDKAYSLPLLATWDDLSCDQVNNKIQMPFWARTVTIYRKSSTTQLILSLEAEYKCQLGSSANLRDNPTSDLGQAWRGLRPGRGSSSSVQNLTGPER